ncbi:hypothetical protein [Streptomyces sp. NPDC004284]|uniref:hypothetical protein n=1 Tax=Streptomyces sp. NPDC004284 TaxID=3364695 RepID=UPI003676D187
MPSLLHYEVLTDPTSLQVSRPGAPSAGTVYVIVSNPHLANVKWQHIDVLIPIGSGSGDLTDDAAAITASIPTRSYQPLPGEEAPHFTPHPGGGGRYRAAAPSGQDMTLPGQGHLILKLENIPVSDQAGLAVVSIHEIAYGGDGNALPYTVPGVYYGTTLGLVKQTPQVPQNFRADHSMVDAGQNVVLRWEGPDSLTYWIRYPDGALERVDPPVRPTPTPYGPHRHTPGRSLTRGTTYTLVAGTVDGNGKAQEGYFLTTTVHATVPEFDSGARAPWIGGTTDRGRVTFTPQGARVDNDTNTPGTVTAAEVDVETVVATTGVRAPWVEGTANKGRVTFATNGVEVHRPDGGLGTVTADDVTTRVVQGLTDSAGWITFPDRGVNVYHGHDATPGVLTTARVDAEEGVNTPWVGDRTGAKGWIDFAPDGVDVRKDGTDSWGTLHADKAAVTGVNTEWVQGRSAGDGWIDFPPNGIRVHRDGGNDRGDITAGKADLDELHTKEARVKGQLTVGGGMKLSHDGQRLLSTLPDRIIFSGINEFKKWVTFDQGLAVAFGNASVSMTKDTGMIVRNSNLEIQQGKFIESHSNPPHAQGVDPS